MKTVSIIAKRVSVVVGDPYFIKIYHSLFIYPLTKKKKKKQKGEEKCTYKTGTA